MKRPIPQAGAIPYRRRGDDFEFCMVSTSKGKRWIFPKGIIDPGDTFVDTALKEAHEEAGLHGNVVGKPLGTYKYSKWGTTLNVTVVLMEVTQVDDDWEEASVRDRRWVREDEASQLISPPKLRKLLRIALTRINKRHGDR